MTRNISGITTALLTSAMLAAPLLAAQTTPAAPVQVAPPADPERERVAAASDAERAREMALLGITALTATVSARDPSRPDFANFDEARANPFPVLPDPLTNEAGAKVTKASWPARRAEIAELFDREVYGRVPANVPGVTWRVAETVTETIGSTPVVTRKLIGHVDNSAAPGIAVDILMNVTTPAAKQGRHVPIVMSFGSVNPRPRPPGAPAFTPPPGPDYREQLLAKNWGFATLDTASVQADNAAGLTQGIIGLVNKGQPRGLEDWGVLRAWGWGASRGLDYLATDADVDAKKIAIFGHSRGGKAALVALAYDPRFATGFISSSGAGGAALYRRNFGEGVPNLAAANEFHWFAGNFLKYAAAGHTANEMPVDSHELIAMVAPRPLFVGGGALIMTPASSIPGDGWVDARGMFMASAAASPVWTLLGRKGLQTTQFPAILTYLGDGDIGFRQHTEGHTPNPNWPYFIQFASKYWK